MTITSECSEEKWRPVQVKNFIKYQGFNCKGIIENSSEDNVIKCGHCVVRCNVPEEIGAGVVIDGFLIEKLLGAGGMGNVYQAH